MYIYIFIYLFIYLSIYLFIWLFIYYIYLHIDIFIIYIYHVFKKPASVATPTVIHRPLSLRISDYYSDFYSNLPVASISRWDAAMATVQISGRSKVHGMQLHIAFTKYRDVVSHLGGPLCSFLIESKLTRFFW